MLKEVGRLVREYASTRQQTPLERFSLTGTGCWTMDCRFVLNDGEEFQIRNVASGDETLLKLFGQGLGDVSRDHFCPYPWGNESDLTAALTTAVQHSLDRIDLSFIMFCNELPIGHFFLWKAGGNAHSRAYGVEVPELGVAVADKYQRRGLGALSVRLLVAMARSLGADAVELTTAMSNSAGWNTYVKTGFEYVGSIRNPLEVDVTSAILGQVTASKYREERQMIFIIEPARRSQVMEYLAIKRAQSA